MAGTANDYIGTLAVTRSGRTCAPWLSDYDFAKLEKAKLAKNKESRITIANSTAAANATNTTAEVASQSIANEDRMWKRTFKSKNKNETSELKDSRLRGANDKKTGPLIKPIHPVNSEYFNDTLYPDHSARNASNYCRDPSRNIAGTWCYTTDPLVPQDLCDVRDCEKPGKIWVIIRKKLNTLETVILHNNSAEK